MSTRLTDPESDGRREDEILAELQRRGQNAWLADHAAQARWSMVADTLADGVAHGAKLARMARAAGISRQTAYNLIERRRRSIEEADAREADGRDQYAEHLRIQRVVSETFASPEGLGHAPRFPKPRRGRADVPAQELWVGARVRVRYFDYDEQKEILTTATVAKCELDPGCPWNAAFPPTVWLLLECADGNARIGRPRPDARVEVVM